MEKIAPSGEVEKTQGVTVEELLEGLRRSISTHGLSLSQAAKTAEVNKSTISQILNRRYNGNLLGILLKIRDRFRDAGLWVENGAGVEPAQSAAKPRFKVDPAVFIETRNVQAFRELVLELLSGEALLGPTLGAVTGLTGRGKSTAAKHIAATVEGVIYLRALPFWSTTDLLREICFALTGERPRYKAKCMELIGKRCQTRRRLLIVDEADGLTLREHLNPLRGLNEVCQMPVVFVGEEKLPEVLREERRLWHRVRRVVVFSDITPGDLVLFWKEAVGLQLSREVAEALYRRCGGDFRLVVGDAENACRLMNTLSATEMTMEIVSKLPEFKPE